MVELHRVFQETKNFITESLKKGQKYDSYIVVLDDDNSVFSLIESVLRLKNIGIIKLNSIEYCYEIFDIFLSAGDKLKLFILDLCLPSGNIEKLINHIQAKGKPILIYSGASDFSKYEKYKNTGTIEFFSKGDYNTLKQMSGKIKEYLKK